MGEATILHADLDAFFASVEQRDHAHLRGRPVIVGGGVVLAASYEARAFGVRSAMGGRQARRLCPDAVVVAPRFSAYLEASRAVAAIFDDTAPLVERLSIDEAFLDMRGLERIAGSPVAIAERLRDAVRRKVGLPISVGVARTKSIAKVASAHAKPDGLLVVPAGSEREFLHPLPVQRLWGVGPATTVRLNDRGLRTVGQLAQLEEGALTAMLGRGSGRHLFALCRGHDSRPVRARRGRRSVGSQSALGTRPRSPEELDAVLAGLVDRVARRMRRGGHAGRTVVLRLRFADFSRATRSRTLPHATAATAAILSAVRELWAEAGEIVAERGLTLVGIAVSNLAPKGSGIQLELPLAGPAGDPLDATIDELRDRFGSAAIARAALLGKERNALPWLFSDEAPESRDRHEQ